MPTGPQVINYNGADAPTTAAPSHSNSAALNGHAPSYSNVAALSGHAPQDSATAALNNHAPSHSNPAALNGTAPGHTNPAALNGHAPGNTNPAAPNGHAPSASAAAIATDSPPTSVSPTGGILSLPSMPSTFQPAFINLSGTGPTLKSLNASAADAAASKILQGLVNGALKSYTVAAGTDAENLPSIVHPANYDPVNNAVVFVMCE